jgi:hypothetical protein
MHTTRRERAAGLESQVTSELMAGRWSSELNESPTTHGICPECLAIAPRSDHERITPNR